jgi:hypothetical protein
MAATAMLERARDWGRRDNGPNREAAFRAAFPELNEQPGRRGFDIARA